MTDIWDYPTTLDRDTDIVGYEVEAADGSIGKIDEATYDQGSSYVVVDTGPWIFGRKVLLPAGVITSVDHEDGRVHVSRTKDEIKNSPELHETQDYDDEVRRPYGDYYGDLL